MDDKVLPDSVVDAHRGSRSDRVAYEVPLLTGPGQRAQNHPDEGQVVLLVGEDHQGAAGVQFVDRPADLRDSKRLAEPLRGRWKLHTGAHCGDEAWAAPRPARLTHCRRVRAAVWPGSFMGKSRAADRLFVHDAGSYTPSRRE